MKICTMCGESKPLGGFYRDKTKKDGRRSLCQVCHRKKGGPRTPEQMAAKRAEIEKVRCLHGTCMRPGTSLKQGFGFRFCDIHAHYARKILDKPTRAWPPAGYALPKEGIA